MESQLKIVFITLQSGIRNTYLQHCLSQDGQELLQVSINLPVCSLIIPTHMHTSKTSSAPYCVCVDTRGVFAHCQGNTTDGKLMSFLQLPPNGPNS